MKLIKYVYLFEDCIFFKLSKNQFSFWSLISLESSTCSSFSILSTENLWKRQYQLFHFLNLYFQSLKSPIICRKLNIIVHVTLFLFFFLFFFPLLLLLLLFLLESSLLFPFMYRIAVCLLTIILFNFWFEINLNFMFKLDNDNFTIF